VSRSAGRYVGSAALGFVASLLLTAPAAATTYRLQADGTGDYPTIQAAVDSVINGDVIELYPGTYSGSGNVNVNYLGKAITIKSRFGVAEQVVILCDPANSERGFLFWSGEGANSVLQAVTIRDGRHYGMLWGAGGIECIGASPTIRRCIIENCDSNWEGGGMYVQGDPWIEDCIFRENGDGVHSGGALAIQYGGSAPTVTGCRFEDNAGGSGGAVQTYEADAHFIDCLFLNNHAHWGGAFEGGGTVEDCVFFGNGADTLGGAITAENDLVISNCTLYGNIVVASEGSGGIYVRWEAASIENTIIASTLGAPAVACNPGSGTVSVSCSDVYGNMGGDWVDCIAGLGSLNGNFTADPLFCDPENHDLSLAACSPCLPPNNTCGVQIGACGEGCVIVGSPEITLTAPKIFEMGAPAPNPFVSSSTVRVGVPEACQVRLTVHDVAGRRVAVLVDQPHAPGWYERTWDGRDDLGRRVSSGIYFVRMETGEFTAARKVIRLR
jgi:predicted outer membrane repeat protein